ncbi:MAG: hypothetical protein AAB617_03155 [Patescibacteria group bacterium]
MKNRNGQSLIEILIGLALIVLGLGSAVVLVYGGQLMLLDRDNASTAKSLASEGVSGASRIVKNNWSVISDGNYGLVFASGTWQFSSTSDISLNLFTRRINVKTVGTNQREIKSTVSWSPDPLRNLSVELVTMITNWTVVQDTGGDTGGGGTTGDWQNPKTLGSVDLGPGNSATDLDVINKIVYMSSKASSAAKPDFFIVNATNGQSPSIASSLNTGPGLNAVDVAGNYAYVANDDTKNQLQIISVSNISNPVLVTSSTFSGSEGGISIFYKGNKIYFGMEQNASREFYVIDVSAPSAPVVLGSYEIGADVNSIFVSGDTAYLATAIDSKELLVLDVSNPAAITESGFYDISGGANGLTAYPVDTKLYFGRASGSNKEFDIFNISNQASPALLVSKDISVDLNDLRIRDNLAFLGTSDSNKEFQVWNISSSSNPTLWSSFNFSQVATAVDYEDNLVYVAVRSNDALRIITSQ